MSTHASVTFAATPSKLFNPCTAHFPTFAFARIQGNICLVQLVGQTAIDASGTPLLDTHIFRHEFVSIFRYSHSARVHPLEIRVLEPLDNRAVRYEEDNGTVFLAKDLMAHLRRIIDAPAMSNRAGRRTLPSW